MFEFSLQVFGWIAAAALCAGFGWGIGIWLADKVLSILKKPV